MSPTESGGGGGGEDNIVALFSLLTHAWLSICPFIYESLCNSSQRIICLSLIVPDTTRIGHFVDDIFCKHNKLPDTTHCEFQSLEHQVFHSTVDFFITFRCLHDRFKVLGPAYHKAILNRRNKDGV